MTKVEFKELINEVNGLIASAKNITKLKKAKALVIEAREQNEALIEEYIKTGKHVNRLNSMHDIAYELEAIESSLENRIFQKNLNHSELYNLSQFDAWVD